MRIYDYIIFAWLGGLTTYVWKRWRARDWREQVGQSVIDGFNEGTAHNSERNE